MFSVTRRLANLPRIAAPSRTFTSYTLLRRQTSGDDPHKPLSQGHANEKAGRPEGGLDVQSAAVKAGKEQAKEDEPSAVKAQEESSADTATQAAQSGSFKDHRGNVQSSGTSGKGGSVGGSTEASAPSFAASAKQALGLGTSKSDHKESKTAPGRKFSTSATLRAPTSGDGATAVSADGEGARKQKDNNVQGDQNAHLKHKEPGAKDSGKGNASVDPHLPSKSSGTRSYHSSARVLAAKDYVAATPSEAGKAGYDAPQEAYPSASLYDRPPPASPSLTPSSEMAYSSTSSDPPHELLAKAAKEGTLAERNEQPTEETGRKGLEEGWKSRKAELKK